jgi:hypothetical protein
MPWPAHRKPANAASKAISHSRSGVTKNQVSGDAAMPKEQRTRTGPAPTRSTAWPQSPAEAMRSVATPTP